MALDFKQTTKKPCWKPKSRGTKWFKNIEGNHVPRKLLHYKSVGSYAWIRCNINRWLHKQLDRPIDDVFSDFVKEFKKSFRGANTPEEIFYQYVDKEKNNRKEHMYWWPWFYVSRGGFLCEYRGKVSCDVYNKRRRAPQAHVDFNIKVLKSLKMGEDEAGPKYVGKLWVRAKGITKVLNTWLVREIKLNNGKGLFGRNKLSEAEKYNLSLYTIANVEGIGSKYDIDQHPHNCMVFFNPFVYRFIVKLSDLK